MKLKITGKDVQFVLNAFGIALLVLALMFAFLPYMEGGSEQDSKAYRAMDARIVVVPLEQVERFVRPKQGKPVMLVLYASWCPYCHVEIPTILEMMAEHSLDHLSPVFLSLDKQPRQLSKYLIRNGFDSVIDPYMVEDTLFGSLSDSLQVTGSRFKGAIPYVAFFDNDGKIVAELFGLVDKQMLLSVVNKLKH